MGQSVPWKALFAGILGLQWRKSFELSGADCNHTFEAIRSLLPWH